MSQDSPPAARSVFFPDRPRTPADQARIEALFFSRLRMPNGAFKATAANRLCDLDAAVIRLLDEKSEFRFLDLGVSSAVTTVEFVHRAECAGKVCVSTAVDLYARARLSRFLGIDILSHESGRLLQIAGPFGVYGRPQGREPTLFRRVANAVLDSIGATAKLAGGAPVQLVSAELTTLPDIEIEEWDVLEQNPQWRDRFDLVRAANLLNLEYFTASDIRAALGFLGGYLKSGGLLALCRTMLEDGSNHGSILRKTHDGRLETVMRLGNGSEVEDLCRPDGESAPIDAE